MRSFVLFLLLACASAFELATLANRRAVIAKIAAAVRIAMAGYDFSATLQGLPPQA